MVPVFNRKESAGHFEKPKRSRPAIEFRLARARAPGQTRKEGQAGIDQDQLAVEDGRLRGQLPKASTAPQTVGVFGTVA